MNNKVFTAGTIALAFVVLATPVAYAATTANSQLTQTINAGVLHTDVRTAAGAVVASPSFGMSAGTVSTSSQQTVTGTFGSDSQRITVDNPGASNTGFTLALAATGGPTATWTNGTNTYPFNAATPAAGQLTINPVAGTVFASVGTTTGVVKGASAGTFSNGTNTPVQIINAGASSDDVWNGYITGIGVSQTIPAATPAGSYTISLTQTVAAQ